MKQERAREREAVTINYHTDMVGQTTAFIGGIGTLGFVIQVLLTLVLVLLLLKFLVFCNKG